MTLERIFFMDGRLRPLWRCCLACQLLVIAYLVSGTIVESAYGVLRIHPGGFEAYFWGAVVVLLEILAIYKLMTAVFEQRPLGSVGLAFHRCWWKEFAHGFAVAAVMILTLAVLEWVGGFVEFTPAREPLLRVASLPLVVLSVAAINEEAIFRGYPFQRLVESLTPAGAILVSSAGFGLVHLGNPHHTWFSTANTMLVGIPLAIAYLRTRSLWMPIGIHFTWNFFMGFLLGLPLSGISIPVSVLEASVHGPAWVTGAEYGPEGGMVATLVIVAATGYLLFSKRIYTSEEMKNLVLGPLPARGPDRILSILATSSQEESKRV